MKFARVIDVMNRRQICTRDKVSGTVCICVSGVLGEGGVSGEFSRTPFFPHQHRLYLKGDSELFWVCSIKSVLTVETTVWAKFHQIYTTWEGLIFFFFGQWDIPLDGMLFSLLFHCSYTQPITLLQKCSLGPRVCVCVCVCVCVYKGGGKRETERDW